MTENLTNILVFKTNINTEADKMRVSEFLINQALVEDWNVDMDDIDRVLRIVSYELCAKDIEELIRQIGFQCQELE
jgi:hypothetical protein